MASGRSGGAHDIAAQLGGLSITGKPRGSAGGAGLVTPALPHRDAGPAAEASSSDGKCLTLTGRGNFKLNARVSAALYPHQVEGVRWLWFLHCRQRGGILADDMGLGKTIQCAAFLAGLIESKLIRRALVLAPKTLLAQWQKELKFCGLGSSAAEYGGTAHERAAALDRVVRRHGVLLTTYGMVPHNAEALGSHSAHDPDEGPMWDVMICDEGHKLKNPRMQLRQRLDAVPVALRIIISGTPIQNDLMEMWALFNFCAPDVLGSAPDFKAQYERIITKGRDKHATRSEQERGEVAAARLRQAIGPYMLRREKKDLFEPSGGAGQQGTAQPDASAGAASDGEGSSTVGTAALPAMPHKNDLIVWLKLKPIQRRVYQAFLNSGAVKKVLNESAMPLPAITVLQKVCNHPALLSERAAQGVISGASGEGEEGEGENRGKEDWNLWARTASVQQLLDEVHTAGFSASCKTVFVMALLKNLVEEGHRTLIFSRSRVMLNILESAIREEGWRFCRIDGSVASAKERQARVHEFETSSTIPVFLLTSQVGGLGLTLTAADRVIILDPAWNPSTDNQSVDRAYRLGQKRDVVVFRLITCGTVEEKMYCRQVFKGGLSLTGMEEGEQFRYFSEQELRDLFRLDLPECEASRTQRELHALHAHQRRETPKLRRHLEHLATLDCYAGVSDHDLLFSKKEREAPPTSITARANGASRAAGAPDGTAGTGSADAGGSSHKGVFGRTATQGWNGGNELSDRFSKAVTISGGGAARSGAAAAAGTQPPNSGWAGAMAKPGASVIRQSFPTQRRLSGSGRDPLQERIEKLEQQLERARNQLRSAARLADGGRRLRSQVVNLERELEKARGAAGGGTAAISASHSDAASASAAAPAPAPPLPPPLPVVNRGQGLPTKPAHGSSSLLAAPASTLLPSGKAAGHSTAPAVPRAGPKAGHGSAAAPSAVRPAAPSLQGAGGSDGTARGARSPKELMDRLKETTREIEHLKGGGMSNRRRLKKLRRRARHLADEYKAAMDAEEAKAGGSAS